MSRIQYQKPSNTVGPFLFPPSVMYPNVSSRNLFKDLYMHSITAGHCWTKSSHSENNAVTNAIISGILVLKDLFAQGQYGALKRWRMCDSSIECLNKEVVMCNPQLVNIQSVLLKITINFGTACVATWPMSSHCSHLGKEIYPSTQYPTCPYKRSPYELLYLDIAHAKLLQVVKGFCFCSGLWCSACTIEQIWIICLFKSLYVHKSHFFSSARSFPQCPTWLQ